MYIEFQTELNIVYETSKCFQVNSWALKLKMLRGEELTRKL